MENMNTQRKMETEEASAIVRDIQNKKKTIGIKKLFQEIRRVIFWGNKEGHLYLGHKGEIAFFPTGFLLSRARDEVVLPFFYRKVDPVHTFPPNSIGRKKNHSFPYIRIQEVPTVLSFHLITHWGPRPFFFSPGQRAMLLRCLRPPFGQGRSNSAANFPPIR